MTSLKWPWASYFLTKPHISYMGKHTSLPYRVAVKIATKNYVQWCQKIHISGEDLDQRLSDDGRSGSWDLIRGESCWSLGCCTPVLLRLYLFQSSALKHSFENERNSVFLLLSLHCHLLTLLSYVCETSMLCVQCNSNEPCLLPSPCFQTKQTHSIASAADRVKTW